MRIVLITTPTRLELPNATLPMGILAIAAYLEQQGHEIRVIDAALRRQPHRDIVREAQGLAPDLIGIGGIITAYAYVKQLTHELKGAMPGVPIVLGGHMTISTASECFNNMDIDFMVHGYGEIPMTKLLRHLQGQWDIRSIPGLSYLEGDTVCTNPGREFVQDINTLPLPSYRHVDMEHYTTITGEHPRLGPYLKHTGKSCDSQRFSVITGALGCIARCSFCVHEQEYVGLRYFSHDYILNHVQHLYDTYGVRVLAIGEEMFILNLERFRAFNRLMTERFPDVFWETHGRAESFTPELIEEMQRGNCFTTGFGIESISTRILRLMQKGTTREQNIASYRLIRSAGILPAASLMIGNVGEDGASIRETIRGIREAGVLNSCTANFLATPYPGGRIWDWLVQSGLIADTHKHLLSIFNKDAHAFTFNLTPHPDWVLINWQEQIRWALREQSVRLLGEKPQPKPLRYCVRKLMALGYEAWTRLRRLVYLTKRERRYAFNVDAKGALLPDVLVRGAPPRPCSPDGLATAPPPAQIRHPFCDRRAEGRRPPWWEGTYVRLH